MKPFDKVFTVILRLMDEDVVTSSTLAFCSEFFSTAWSQRCILSAVASPELTNSPQPSPKMISPSSNPL